MESRKEGNMVQLDTVEVCRLTCEGVVASTGRGKENDRTYVRFLGRLGQVTLVVPDGAARGVTVNIGDRVRVVFDIEVRGQFQSLVARELSPVVAPKP